MKQMNVASKKLCELFAKDLTWAARKQLHLLHLLRAGQGGGLVGGGPVASTRHTLVSTCEATSPVRLRERRSPEPGAGLLDSHLVKTQLSLCPWL